VVGADGSLTGYAGGVERKRQLLALERATSAPGQAALRAPSFQPGPMAKSPATAEPVHATASVVAT